MRPYGPKKVEPSLLGRMFTVNQEVSFTFKGEPQTGTIEKLLQNAAIILVYEHEEVSHDFNRVVVSYSKMESLEEPCS